MEHKNNRLKKLVATSVLFASASWASAMDIQGFFSAGGGITFDTKKLPRFENMIADPDGTAGNLNTVSEYHKTVSPSIRELSSRFNAHRDNKIGLQFYRRLGDDLSITTQLIAKGFDSYFDVNASWGFLSWNAKPDFTVRAGRLVIPLFMLSEYLEVGYAYPWVRPPMEMYSGVPLSSWSGMDFSWTGYRGDWDYRVTTAFGTVDQNIWIGTIQSEFVARNGVSVSAEFGNDYLRMRLGASRIDAMSDLGVASVDGLVGGIGDLYSAWAVNKFDTDNNGVINTFKMSEWSATLGNFTSSKVEALTTASGLWGEVTGELDNANNLAFLQSATAVGLSGAISSEIYEESTNAGFALANAYGQSRALAGTLPSLQTLGSTLAGADSEAAETRDGITAQLPTAALLYDLGVLASVTGPLLLDLNAIDPVAIADAVNSQSGAFSSLGDMTNALVGTENTPVTTVTDDNILAIINQALVVAGDEQAFADAAISYTTATLGNPAYTDAANQIFGVLGALGATENAGRFNSVASLIALSGDQVDSNYGLLQQAISGVVNETYLMELREHLYKTFDHEWRSGSFLSAGYTYDYDDWYSIGEYGYRRVPGYLGDTEGWYVTLGRRFGSIMPHVTYAGVSMKDHHVRKVSPGIAENDTNWRTMLDNVQNDDAPISDVTYESMMYGLNQLQDFWLDNQAYTQNSVTVGVRYDWKPGVCLKAEVQHIRPKLGFRGFFEPWDKENKLTGNTLALSIDAVF